MRVPFIKMHGLGNDFVVLDARVDKVPPVTSALARALADRRTGIGCDQLIVLEPSDAADFRMRIRNSDGGEVEACGNATRAVALLHGEPARIETAGGILEVRPDSGGVSVDMGEPRFEWDAIPLSDAMDTFDMPVAWDDLERPTAVNVGNPHVVFFVRDCDQVPLQRLGPAIETDPLFPEGVNVNVATVENRHDIRLRVWERGAGLTRACGTGACATAVAAMRRKLVEREVTVTLPGGKLLIGWGEDNHVTMTGPASESFRGSFDWGEYA
jgi:diaminopimelate epimerase